jgi:hypothetical protein
LDADAFTTPPHLIVDAQEGPSPDDALVVTPSAALSDSPVRSTAPDAVLTFSEGFRSITGADFTQPIFDGRSDNPADHLINLDADSMERIPDVRVYFWAVGDCLRSFGTETASKHTLEEARLYDDVVVREGREHIRACRDRNIG